MLYAFLIFHRTMTITKNTSIILIVAIAAVMVSSALVVTTTNTAHASTFQQRQACSDKYLPNNITAYNICIGGMGSNDTGSRPRLG